MAVLADMTKYLQDSINTPQLIADPSYIAIQGNLGAIIEQVVKDLGYTVENLPVDLENYVILLVKEEIYWRLATATAPNYDLETEFTKLVKSKRFDHYFSLIKQIQYKLDSFQLPVQIADVVLRSREGSYRNHSLASSQSVSVTTSNVTQNSIDLDWSLFDISKGQFVAYDVIVSASNLYDPYEIPPLDYNQAEQLIVISDIKRTKLRVKNLVSATKYYIVIVYKAISMESFATAEVTTL